MLGFHVTAFSQVMLGLPMLEGSNPASCFPCSAIGFEAACYSRVWSEVYVTLQARESFLEFALLLINMCLACSKFFNVLVH